MRTPGAISSHCSEASKPPSRCARAVGPIVVAIAGAPGTRILHVDAQARTGGFLLPA